MATQPATLYHLIPQAEWEAAKSRGTTYFPPSYGADGFTHLSDDADSLVDIANHFYREVKGDFVLLSIDPLRAGDVRREPAAAVGGTPAHDAPAAALFPHLYGGIKLSSVVEETPVDRTPSGKFMGILWGVTVVSNRADWLKLQG